MMKNWENNGTEEIGLVTSTPGDFSFTYGTATYSHFLWDP